MKPRDLPSDSDVAVIGAGIGGLTCALALAKRGLKVCVLERHRVPGGYAHSFKRKDYTFDVSLHHIAGFDEGGTTRLLLGDLGVLDKLELHRQGSAFSAEFPGLAISLPNQRDEMIAALVARFPQERGGLEALFAEIDLVRRSNIEPWLGNARVDPRIVAAKAEYEGHTLGELLGKHISDPQLLGLLGQVWLYLGLPPDSLAATFASCVFSSTFLEGAHHIVGGGAALARAMVERLRELGGECLCRAEVARVLVEDRTARGVVLKGGETLPARAVVSNADPHQLFDELVPGDVLSKAFRYRIGKLQSSASMYATYLGLDCPPGELGIPPGVSFINYDTDHEQAYRLAVVDEVERTSWCMTSYEGADPTVAPEGCGVVSIAEVAVAGEWLDVDRKEYKRRKEEVRERLMAKYEARFPGLRAHLAVSEFATPRTMARFTRNHEGAVYGLAQTCDQADSKRLPNRTPVSGLYLTGSWTRSGGGYEGAMMAGLQTAGPVAAALGAAEAPPAAAQADAPGPADAPAQAADPATAGAPAGNEASAAPAAEVAGHTIDVRVMPEDLDGQGITAPGAYLRYLDRGRVESVEAVCREQGEASWVDRFVVNVYRLRARFGTPTRRGDRLQVTSAAGKTSSHRATYRQRIVNRATGAVAAEAEVELLFLDQDRTLMPVPEGVAEAPPAAPVAPRPPIGDGQYGLRMPVRVYYEDTDAQGITYHVSYIRFCERAIHEMLEPAAQGVELARVGEADPAPEPSFRMTALELRFLDSSALNDRLEVRSGGRRLSSHQAEIHQRIEHADSGQVVVELVSELEFRDGEGRLVPVPETLAGFLSDQAQA